MSLIKIWKPEVFQGGLDKKKYFEGWYFKLVDSSGENIVALIPGISLTGDKKQSHCFIQVLDWKMRKSYYIKYSPDAFVYAGNIFHISIEDNTFSGNGVELNIEDNSLKLRGSVRLLDMVKWPVSFFSPGAMGWYRFVPFMECYHGIISTSSNLEGFLNLNSRPVDFKNGKGYVEKDWGRSFPRWWIWFQSNHFEDDSVSITGSIAKIPWLNKSFTGFIIGVFINGKIFKFSTYTNAHIKSFMVNGKNVSFTVEDKKYQLTIDLLMIDSAALASPKHGEMSGRIEESLSSTIKFTLSKTNNAVIYSGVGKNSGMEMSENIDF